MQFREHREVCDLIVFQCNLNLLVEQGSLATGFSN
jgi:hypothetical protein